MSIHERNIYESVNINEKVDSENNNNDYDYESDGDDSIDSDELNVSEYSYSLSDIVQIDGNDSVDTEANSDTTKKSSNFRLIEVNINILKGKKQS